MASEISIRFVVGMLCFCTAACWEARVKSIERPLFIGSFNIQNLGSSKMGNKTVMDTVKKVLIRYDLVLVQEIVTTDVTLMENLVIELNKLLPPDSKFMMTISERLGRGTAKEQYAFLYRSEKLSVLYQLTYPDEDDDFMRPPYIVHFASPTLRDMGSFLAIGIHTQPKFAANETGALADVYDYAAKRFRIRDAILMGDMNAGCANVRVSDWGSMALWTRPEFTWLISHDVDTTLSTNCCPYDRFVIAGENMNNAVIWDSINVFNFRDAYGLTTEKALAVSDHWPIEVKLRGSTSEEASSSLQPHLCLTIEDNRKRSLPPQLLKQKSTYSFAIDYDDREVTLYATSADPEDLLQNMQKLSARFGDFLAAEVVETVAYKLEQGALKDPTSHDDLDRPWFDATIEFDRETQTSLVRFCAATTLN